jgi:predicted MFS family arabinose efflux permease
MHVLMPDLVGEDEALVARANALFQTITQGTGVFGPIVAGILVGLAGAATVIVVDAATFVVSGLIVVACVRRDEAPEEDHDASGVLAGLRFLVADSLLLPLVVAALLLSLAHESLVGMLPVLAFQRFGHASAAGVIFAADGVGSVCGSAMVMRLGDRVAARRLIGGSALLMSIALWPLGFRLPLGAVAASMFVFGVGSMLFVPPLVSLLTLRAPKATRPKLLTAYVTVMTLAGPVGLAAAGPSVQAFGLRAVFVGIASTFTVGAFALGVVLARRGRPAADSAGATTAAA